MAAFQKFARFTVLLATLLAASSTGDEGPCMPKAGASGNAESVTLIVETWVARSSNFHWSDPERTSVDGYTVKKSSGVESVVNGARVRFYGDQLCIALMKYTETEKSDGSTERSQSCQYSCIRAGDRTQLESYSGTGGRPSSGDPYCCYWGRTTTLHFSIPAAPTTPPPIYQCPQCTGCEDMVTIPSRPCDAGEQCFTLKTQKNKGDEMVIIKGCSSKLRYWGDRLYCDYGCKHNVPLSQEYHDYRYTICVACCSGDDCNLHDDKGSSHATRLQSQIILPVLVLLTLIVQLV